MFNRIIFYFRQASSNLKHSILIILSISIAISMVAGVLYYNDSFKEDSFNNGLNNIIDFNVGSSNFQINFSSSLMDNYTTISQAVDKSGIDIKNSFEYGFLDTGSCYIYRDLLNGSKNDNISLNVFMTDNNFYETDAFSHFFTLYEGRLPRNSSEILMDITAMDYFNFHVGETVNFTLYYGTSKNMFLSYTIHDITISGVYYANLVHYSILNHTYTEGYNNHQIEFRLSPIFSYKNFSSPIDNNPFQQFSNTMSNTYYNFSHISILSQVGFQYGLGVQYNKNNIHFSNLNSVNQNIYSHFYLLRQYIPPGFVANDYISNEILNIINTTSIPVYSLLVFIIPFLIFAFIIGSFSMSNISFRFDEFFLLESKGIPKSMIRNQLLIENFLIGIISAILSALFGILTYNLCKKLFENILFASANQTVPNFHLFVTWNSIGIIFVICVGISLFSSISGIKTINKVQISELLSTLGEEGVRIEYDEDTLFGEKNVIDESENGEIENEFLNKEISYTQERKKQENSTGIGSIKGNLKYYRDQIKEYQKKIPKISYFFITLSLVPLIFYFIGVWSINSTAEVYLNFELTFSPLYDSFVLILCYIAPILLVMGIIRFLSVESPSRFAKITRFLSKPLLKANSYLVGLEMIKRKKFRKIITIIGIFTSLLVFSNFTFNSIGRYSVMENNLAIGADVKLTANVHTKIYNMSYTQIIDDNLKNITNIKDIAIVNNVLTYYEQLEAPGWHVCYFNFTKYMQVIQEGGKFVPKSLISEFSKVIAYNKNISNMYPGAIIDNRFIKGREVKIGDLISLNHTYYDSQMNNISAPITVKIIGIYNVLPGISVFNKTVDFAIDTSVFNQSYQLLKISKLNQLVDLNLNAESNDTIITNLIKSSAKSLITYTLFSYYNQQWNSPSIGSVRYVSGIFGLTNLGFVIVGIILAIGLASILSSFQNENRYYFGLLMSRGFGKNGIFIFMISQIIIIFLLSIISGVVSGSITSIILIKMFTNVLTEINYELPIFFNPINILEILGLIIGICFISYIATYFIQMRKPISQYMRKF